MGAPPGMLGRDGVPDRQPGVVAQGVGIWRQLRTFQQDGADHPGEVALNQKNLGTLAFFFDLLDFS